MERNTQKNNLPKGKKLLNLIITQRSDMKDDIY